MCTCVQVDAAMKKGDITRLPTLENELETVSCVCVCVCVCMRVCVTLCMCVCMRVCDIVCACVRTYAHICDVLYATLSCSYLHSMTPCKRVY